jgi:threonine/homoserine/homoserine lactone efflux protein
MLEALLPFALLSLAIELTPGPNMAYLAVLSLDRGRIAGLAAVGGVALGLLVLGLVAGFGFGTIISETRWLYEMFRWGGVGYLVWLAWDTYREAQRPLDEAPSTPALAGYFRRGLITNLLNPKAAAFYVAVLPNFIVDGPIGPQALVLTLIYVTVATAVHAAIVLAAGSLQPLLAQSRVRRWAGILFSLLLLGVAIWLGIATHRIWV